MKQVMLVLVVVCSGLMLGGCGGRGRVTVPREAGSYRCDYERVELFFGMSKPDGGSVSDGEFKAFLDASVTPVFPDGLTLVPTTGQWRGKDGKVVKEEGRMLILILPAKAGNQGKVDVVREAYKKQFKQESVLSSRQAVIAEF
jgi:major membrane immunogen (membrane-anchored lipoprotein)